MPFQQERSFKNPASYGVTMPPNIDRLTKLAEIVNSKYKEGHRSYWYLKHDNEAVGRWFFSALKRLEQKDMCNKFTSIFAGKTNNVETKIHAEELIGIVRCYWYEYFTGRNFVKTGNKFGKCPICRKSFFSIGHCESIDEYRRDVKIGKCIRCQIEIKIKQKNQLVQARYKKHMKKIQKEKLLKKINNNDTSKYIFMATTFANG